jgi:hypothetical protein
LQGQKDIQLIFRQVPVENVDRYQQVLNEYPHIVHLNPIWNKGTYWNQYFPLPEDVAHLVNLSYHCATVVNIGSTMALDFSWFDRPGLYLNYDHQPNQDWTVKDVYRFQHFKSMGSWDAVVWASTSSEILEKVKQIINQPESVAQDRKLWLEQIIEPDTHSLASEKLAKAIVSLKETAQPS